MAKKKYTANTNIKHGGKWYKPGAEIALEAAEAELLGADVSIPGDDTPPADDKGDGKDGAK